MTTHTRLASRLAPLLPCLLTTAALVALSGCIVHDRPLETRLSPGVRVPQRSAIVFFVDGLPGEVLDEHLAAGTVPNIQRYFVDRGLRYRRCVTSMPSITYAATTTFITGQAPGRHGIVGNRWFDPYSLEFKSYTYIKTYRTAEDDLHAPTMYDLLHDEFTVSIQVATRPGVTREIDNWATSGINWFFGLYENVDKLTAMRFELIAEIADQTGRWPRYITAYFPACDQVAHEFGVTSRRYRAAVRHVDEQIGRICRGLEANGVLEQTLLVLVSDHGQALIHENGHVDILRYLTETVGLHATDERIDEPDYVDRYEFYREFEAVVVADAGRMAGIHLRPADRPWYERPVDARRMELAAGDKRITAEQLAGRLAAEPFSRLVAVRAGVNRVLLLGPKGKALVERVDEAPASQPVSDVIAEQEDARYLYRLVEGEDPLHLGLGLGPDASLTLTAAEWLARTIETPNPGVVSQIVGYMVSPRAGDVVVFGEVGYGFGADVSGHGSTTPQEMFVPLVFAGPGVARGEVTAPVRIHSVMPTVVSWLGFAERLETVPPLDGPVLALQPADAAQPAAPASGQ